MKNPFLTFALLAALACAPVGCGNKDTVDTAQAESAFANAEPGIKADFDKTLNAIKTGDWPAAGTALKDLAGNAKLTEEQKSSLSSLMERIKAKAGEVAQQAGETTSKAVEKVSAEASKLAEQTKEATSKAVDSATKSVNELLPKK